MLTRSNAEYEHAAPRFHFEPAEIARGYAIHCARHAHAPLVLRAKAAREHGTHTFRTPTLSVHRHLPHSHIFPFALRF